MKNHSQDLFNVNITVKNHRHQKITVTLKKSLFECSLLDLPTTESKSKPHCHKLWISSVKHQHDYCEEAVAAVAAVVEEEAATLADRATAAVGQATADRAMDVAAHYFRFGFTLHVVQ